MKKDKKKIAAIATAIVAILIIVILLITAGLNPGKTDDVNTEEPLVRDDGLELTLTEDKLNEMIDYMNTYDEIVIHYNVYENIYDEDNINYIESNYITGISSKVNLLTLDEWTLDSNKIFLDKENPDEYIPTDEEVADATLSFEDVFGINYKDYNSVYDLACDIAKTQGADPNLFVGSRINEGMYDSLYDEDNRRKYFYYENEEFDPQIPDDAEIISKDFRVIINTDNFGKDYISNIDIVINYKKDGKTIEKIWGTEIWLMISEGEEIINLSE